MTIEEIKDLKDALVEEVGGKLHIHINEDADYELTAWNGEDIEQWASSKCWYINPAKPNRLKVVSMTEVEKNDAEKAAFIEAREAERKMQEAVDESVETAFSEVTD